MRKQWTLGDSARRRAAARRRERAAKPIKYRLYVKPAVGYVPKWWPRPKVLVGRRALPSWVGVTECGWNEGPGDAFTHEELQQARASVEVPGPARGRRFRIVPVVDR